jgi:type I restriction enzyme R subunit
MEIKKVTMHPPARVAADAAYQNARKFSDKENARIEHDKALGRVMTALIQDDTELFKQFSDNESFRRWLQDKVFELTYGGPASAR